MLFRSVSAMINGQVLPETSRFNWKDGFYSPEKMEEYRSANERGTSKNQKQKQKNYPKKKRR